MGPKAAAAPGPDAQLARTPLPMGSAPDARAPSVPTVRVCEPRAGAAGDPQLRPRGVGRHQVSDTGSSSAAPGGSPGPPVLPPELCPAPRFILRFLLPSRARISETPPPAAHGRRCAPTLRGQDPGGGAAGRGEAGRARARERGEKKEGKEPPGQRGLRTRPSVGTRGPRRALPGSAGPAAPTRRRAPGTTKASATFQSPEALDTNGRPGGGSFNRSAPRTHQRREALSLG